MRNGSLIISLGTVCYLLSWAAPASATLFRNPFNETLSPPFSAYYDDDSSAHAKNYRCGTDTVYNNHRGTDFRAALGTPVYAGASGRVYHRVNDCPTYGYIGSACGGGFGNHVRIDHEGDLTDGQGWVSIYAHLQKDTPILTGPISCGAYVGLSGSSGSSSGPHLHFEIRKYVYPFNDPFDGACSSIQSLWTTQNTDMPTTLCKS